VLESTWEYTLEGKPPVTLKAGDVLFIPAGAIPLGEERRHRQRSRAATYIFEKGKPFVVLSK
jgi:quercetin dioxygenase-like cupin family protein